MPKYRRITRIVEAWTVSDIIAMTPRLPECLNKMYAAGNIDISQDSVVIHIGDETLTATNEDVIVCNEFGNWCPYTQKDFAEKYEPAPGSDKL